MSDLTPKETAALRARIVEGADALPRRGRSASRIAAVASAVLVVAAVSVGAVSLALGLGPTTETMATPDPTPSASQSVTSTPTPADTPSPTSAPPTTPSPTPIEPPVIESPVLEHGQNVVTEEEWQLLSERGWGYYYMREPQRYIATDPSQDLPSEVTADIQRRMDAIPNNTMADADGTTALTATYALMMDVRPTGKEAVMIRYNSFSVPGEPNGIGMRWYARATQDDWWMPLSKSRDQLLADVNAWVAANTSPGSWVVFVGPGEPVVP